ncbi:hypothetical protein RB195_017241 [Necator americanus]|uniref:Uncharacterized protein n=1 Tax=Necator americanus TaxID=51031 RepID=A0ABR1C4D3_NECAM
MKSLQCFLFSVLRQKEEEKGKLRSIENLINPSIPSVGSLWNKRRTLQVGSSQHLQESLIFRIDSGT